MVAGRAADLVEEDMLVGIGSGTTAELFLRALEPRLRSGLRIRGVASSIRSERIAAEIGLPLVALTGTLDLAVDGADAIERGTLATIKGLGGALTREKLIADAAQRFVLIADDSKLFDRLSQAIDRVPVPVEVLSFGWQLTQERLSAFGTPVLRVGDGTPFVTDNGNFVLDLHVAFLDDPAVFGQTLHSMTGVVEHGLFVGMASLALVGSQRGVIELTRER